MVQTLVRLTKGLSDLKSDNTRYFTEPAVSGGTHSHFRQDLRAIVGGALAAAFVAAAFTSVVELHFVSDTVFTFLAGVIGAIGGKYALV